MCASPNLAAAAPAQTLQQAMALHQAGRLDEALAAYERLLAANPRLADAWHLMGLVHAQRRRFEEAGRLIGKAIALQPREALFHNNLGNVWVERGRPEEALASFRRAHALDRRRPDVRNNLGVLLSRLGQGEELDEAERLFRGVMAEVPAFTDAAQNLANHFMRHGRLQEAMEVCVEALIVAPANPEMRRVLGVVYSNLGMTDKAAELYRGWLAQEPDNAEALFRLRACTQEDVPERAPDDFVAMTFDIFADSFDAKLASLSYRAPELVAEAVARHASPPAAALDIADAGCGTGLCGPLLKPWARTLAGVDLSPAMLAKAQERGLYDELEAAELVAWLQRRPQSCELLVSADTLCYFGALDGFAAAARGALREGGLLVFTVEALAEEPGAPEHRLQPSGRYSHRRGYVEAALRGAGLQPLELQAVHLRKEAGKPVDGWLVSARATTGVTPEMN